MTTAAILIIGNEVLSGKVEEINSPFLVRSLRQRGVELVEIRIVPDTVATIAAAVRALAANVDYLFTTGGIGPTHDDVTIEAVALAHERPVEQHPELVRRLEARYGTQLSATRLRLAEVPAGATILTCPDNPVSVVRYENLFILPGVPSLMRLCFERLADELQGSPLYSEALFLNVAESEAAEPIALAQRRHPEIAIGSYPRFDGGPYRVKVTVDGRGPTEVARAIDDLRQSLPGDWLVDAGES